MWQSAILVNSVRIFKPFADMSHKCSSVSLWIDFFITAFSIFFSTMRHYSSNSFYDFWWNKVKPIFPTIVFKTVCDFVHFPLT